MKFSRLWMGALVLMTALPALAVDHNNVDAHRPLTFDDAGRLRIASRPSSSAWVLARRDRRWGWAEAGKSTALRSTRT